MSRKAKIAVWKFSSCDGCQLNLLNCEDALLAVTGAVDIAYFPEATTAVMDGPYDVSLVEGSVTTPEEASRIQEIRQHSTILIAIGACATSGGIQALKNFKDVNEFISIVYAEPKYIESLDTATPISDHVKIDFQLNGCPVNKLHLVEALSALLNNRRINIPKTSVCADCKLNGNPCVMVAQGVACLGPVTNGGCGALCPSYHRGCYGCFGPAEQANTEALSQKFKTLGLSNKELARLYHQFNANAPAFKEEGNKYAD
jgi:coenzyme F420-reducing hydrogenase gamma subunit